MMRVSNRKGKQDITIKGDKFFYIKLIFLLLVSTLIFLNKVTETFNFFTWQFCLIIFTGGLGIVHLVKLSIYNKKINVFLSALLFTLSFAFSVDYFKLFNNNITWILVPIVLTVLGVLMFIKYFYNLKKSNNKKLNDIKKD